MALRMLMAVLIGGLFSVQGSGQQVERVSDQELQLLAESFVSESEIPGMILAILDHSRITAIGCAGIRKVGSDEKITAHDQIHLGSCTKAMTAALIARLVDQGKLQWESTVGDVLPELRGKIHDDYLPVSLAQLLAHRGGLPPNARNWWIEGTDPIDTRHKILIQSLSANPSQLPGTRFVYSNLGYVLAAHMAERVCDREWEALIREHIFEPLQMTSAGFGAPNTPDATDQPWGHVEQRSLLLQLTHRPTQTDNAPALGPAGTVHCSVEDWAKFLDLHLHPDRGAQVLPPDSIVRLQTPDPRFSSNGRQYAGGWIVNSNHHKGQTTLSHSGSNTTWITSVQLVPSRGVGFVVAINAGGRSAQRTADDAIDRLIEMYPPQDDSRSYR